MDYKLLGGILLIVGTSIGAGMLALPIVTAQLGFLGSLVMLVCCWLLMSAGAFVLLEVNLWMRQNSNIITMAKATVGPLGAIFAWLTYLVLLYSLLCAYIGGGSSLFHHLFFAGAFKFPEWVSALLFTLLFGGIVTVGIHMVDYVNRMLMLIKFAALFILIGLLFPQVSQKFLLTSDLAHMSSSTAIIVTITSFGFATIIPSMRVYFQSDVAKLKKAIFLGSLIPLICYILWDIAIMGTVPLEGEHGLKSLLLANDATTSLVTVLTKAAASDSIAFFAKVFTSVCVLTSFLGVALCLSDFLADGIQVEKKGWGLIGVQLLTFLPPLIVTLFYPNIFIKGLEYAGIACILLLLLLPACMAWCGRAAQRGPQTFEMWGGKMLLIGMVLFSCALIGWTIKT